MDADSTFTSATEIAELRRRLEEAEQTLWAIRQGEVDALVVEGGNGPQVYTLKSAAEPYRVLVEQMREGALTLTKQGVILYCNEAFARIAGADAGRLTSSSVLTCITEKDFEHLAHSGGCQGYETLLKRKDGTQLPAYVSSVPFNQDGKELISMTVTDLTGQQIRQRYDAIIETTSLAMYVLSPELIIETWNPGAGQLYGYTAAEMIGGSEYDLCPSVEYQALEDFQREASRRGSGISCDARRRHKDGTTLDVIFSLAPLRDSEGMLTGYSATAHDVTSRKRAEKALRESEALLRAVTEHNPGPIFLKDLEGRLRFANPATLQVIGKPAGEVIGKTDEDYYANPEDGRAIMDNDRRIMESRQGEAVEETVSAPDGSRRFFISSKAPFYDGEGQIAGLIGMAQDITERKHAEELVHLLMRELNHRAKNLLALVLAIAQQTVAANHEDFLARFSERVYALAASQDLLVKGQWKGVGLDDLVSSQLAHFNDLLGRRIIMSGPPVNVSVRAAPAVAMAIHELATNAGKYGALSNGSGCVEFTWGIEQSQQADFVMTWSERGGPSPKAPAGRGFGSYVIREMIEASLDAAVSLDFGAGGLTWQMRCPAGAVTDDYKVCPSGKNGSFAHTAGADLTATRPRVLIVEDEPILALEIANTLTRAGFDIVGPARDLKQALDLLRTRGCDTAVLDINLGTETSEPVAAELTRRGTPFVTLSAYNREQQRPVFQSAPALSKPLRPELLVAEVTRCVSAPRSCAQRSMSRETQRTAK